MSVRLRRLRSLGAVLLSCLLAFALAPAVAHADTGDDPEFRALLFTKTAGYRHDSIPSGVALFERLAEENDFAVDHTEDSAVFDPATLAEYDVIVMFQTSGMVWETDAQRQAVQDYVAAGGGIAAIHNATDMGIENDFPWWDETINAGAHMPTHSPGVLPGTAKVADRTHPSTANLPAVWERSEEWYNFDANMRGDVHVLVTADETTYDPGPDAMGHDHPISWCRDVGGAPIWATAMGHPSGAYSEPEFIDHLLGGVRTAAGVAEADCGGTVWDNYEKVPLDTDTYDPMGLSVADDGRVLFAQRQGQVRVFDPDTNLTSTLGTLDVYTGGEDGLTGIALDPDFTENGWVYLYYAPASGDDTDPANMVNRVSRFTVVDDGTRLDPESESVLMEIPALRIEEPGHTGGALEMSPDGELYIGVGDDTNPFASDGYSPIDERPGREPWDAQRTSANTADPRGKLLRIVPQDDGTYTVPEDNLFNGGAHDDLFPGGTYDPELAMPEIFAMGFRNPYRFSVDPATGDVLVADYGPDAAQGDPDRGPEGLVEWMSIGEPGNYGWPYCHGPNLPYRDYDFATGASGEPFDCAAPVNDSPNNTGLENLPPSVEPGFHYGYGPSEEWPELGSGAAAPMAGPAYRYDPELESNRKFPAYLDGKNLFYEWGRHYVKEVGLDDEGEVLDITPFVPNFEFDYPMDMEFGPDGALYLLEWGAGFGTGGESGLYRIDYTGGVKYPVAAASAEPDSGGVPLEVAFSSEGTGHPDPDETVELSWAFGDGATSTEANPVHTYTEAGDYTAQLTVTDSAGRTSTANVPVSVGNTRPEVELTVPPDGGTFEFGDEVAVEVVVTDAEDGSTADGTIDCDDVTISASLGHDEHGHLVDRFQGCEAVVPTLADDGHGAEANLFYVLSAEYTDSGGAEGEVAPLTGRADALLQPKRKQAEYHTTAEGVTTAATTDVEGGLRHVTDVDDGDHLSYSPVNLAGIESMVFRVASGGAGGNIEVRADAPDGELLGTAEVAPTGGWQAWTDVSVDVTDPGRTVDLYLVFTGDGGGDLLNLNFVEFDGKGVAVDSRPRVTLTSPENGAEYASGDTVRLSAEATDADHTVEKVEFLAGDEVVGEDTEAPYELDWAAPDGRHQIRARATSDSGFTRDSRRAVVLVGTEEVRAPWTTYSHDGEAAFLQPGEDAWTIESGGANMWQGVDEYGTIYQPSAVGEEFTATVRLDSHEAPNNQGKAGLVVRDDLTRPGEAAGYVAMTATGSGAEMLWDADGDGDLESSEFGGAAEAPVWLRLERSGDTYTGSYSTDGEEFTPVAEAVLESAADRQDIGMVVTAHSADATSRAAFSAFTLDDGPAPEPPVVTAEADPAEPTGSDGWYTSPVTVTLTADDPEAEVEYRLGDGDWTPYTGPVEVADDGEHTLGYRAANDAGTSEEGALDLKVDATAPEVAVTGIEDGAAYGLRSAPDADVAAEDAASGVASVALAVDGTEIDTPAVLDALEPGAHVFTATATDAAGNTAEAEAAIEVTVDYAQAEDLVADYRRDGVLTRGQAAVLTAHLATAERHADRGRPQQAGRALDRFEDRAEDVRDEAARSMLLAVAAALRDDL
ncbi:ThuA domain-containing protein [Nocardiopsis trehalosi]|uniref:ThuA domain-containing protein n=1 Tax=Nocardiopsis trehalosi TaxID=109329 RepID=UPI000A02FF66|nr:ThuA domain-containing protein [Nocardiopsis trehalosi]